MSEKKLNELYEYLYLLHGLWAAPCDVSHASDEDLEQQIDKTNEEIFHLELRMGIIKKNADGSYSNVE